MKSGEAVQQPARPALTLVRPAEPARRRTELEFLPAALEILETPASPAGRAIVGTIILFAVVAVAWATFGYVDIVATAPGKIVPTGRTKTIQALEPGLVTAIRVRDGDVVAAGQMLIELDRTIINAERGRIAHDLRRSQLDVARLRALRAGIEAGAGAFPGKVDTGFPQKMRPTEEATAAGFAPPPDMPAAEVARARATMEAQAAGQAAKLASIDQQVAQKAAEAESIAAMIAKSQAALPLLEQTADVRRRAMEIQYGNRIAHLEAQLRLTEQRHELTVQQRRAVETAAARQSLEAQRTQAEAEYASKVLSDLAEAELKAAQFAEDIIKADEKLEEKLIRAPVAGKVQQLAVHTVGGVVTPAQALMLIVPADSHLEVEAMVSNRDVGFVYAGQEVEIKIDTFNFTRYGLLRGEVLNVSHDAIVREKPPDKSGTLVSGALANSSEPQGQELIYAARVSLDRTRMDIEGRMVDLAPGMAVTVEIKTSQRRIIEYVLSPLLRYKQESLRER